MCNRECQDALIAEQIFKLFKKAEKEAKFKMQSPKSIPKITTTTTAKMTTTTASAASAATTGIMSNDVDASEYGREMLARLNQVYQLNQIYDLFYSRII